jgi:hypothetical protein
MDPAPGLLIATPRRTRLAGHHREVGRTIVIRAMCRMNDGTSITSEKQRA